MKIKDVLAKVAKGEALTDAEKDFLSKYEEPKLDNSANAALKAKIAELETERGSLQAKLEEADGKDKTETEKLQAAVDKANAKIAALEKERDTVKAEKAEIERDNSIRAIASEHRFKSFDFLKFNLGNAKVDLADKDAIKAHMEQLRKDSPEFFTADVNKGGAGSSTGAAGGSGVDQTKAYADAKASGNFAEMVANAPIIKA